MTEYELNRIGVASLAKIQAIIMIAMTILFGWPVIIFEAAIPGAGFISFIFLIVFSAIAGGIAGAITALVYNLAAAPLGGLTLDLADTT